MKLESREKAEPNRAKYAKSTIYTIHMYRINEMGEREAVVVEDVVG